MNLLIPDELLGQQLHSVLLTHPRTGEECLFFQSQQTVYEVVKYSRSIGCLFIGDSVSPDASFAILTRVDPLFFLVPSLVSNAKQFRALDDYFEAEVPLVQELARQNRRHLPSVCDDKEIDGETYYRFSEERTIKWLERKVEALSEVLRRKKVSTSSRSVGLENMKFLEDGGRMEADRLRYACALLEDYLPPDLASRFRSHLRVSDAAPPPKTDSRAASSAKEMPTEDYFVDAKFGMKAEEVKLTRCQKQLAKVDKKGMKPITSFFQSKPK